MNKTLLLEIILVSLNSVTWLGPLCLAIYRRSVSLIHPSSIFPLFVVTSVMVAMTEHWFGWSGRGLIYGLRLTTKTYRYHYTDLFLLPLLIVLIAGLAYHYGVLRGCGRIVSGHIDRIHIAEYLRSVEPKYSILLFFVSFCFALLCVLPYILFGQERGFFWTIALFYALNFIPILLYGQRKSMGLIFLFLCLPLLGLRGSKGDYIYFLLPFFLFYQESLLFGLDGKKFFKKRIKFANSLIFALLIVVGLLGTIQIYESRGESFVDATLVKKIFSREYGFEVFSILVKDSNPIGNFSNASWLFDEFKDALPSFLGFEKKFMSHEVAQVFLPEDYSYIPDAGFYRFFLFAFYRDFGVIGAILGSWLIGFIFGRLYKIALIRTYRYKVFWPLIVYLPIPVYAEMLVNGTISYGLIHVAIGSSVVWLTILLSRQDVV